MGKKSRMKRGGMRHKALMKLRSLPHGGLETMTLRNGAEQIINPMKHFLLGKEYSNPELQKEVLRKIGKFTLGAEKYAALERQAAGISAPVEIETN